MKPSWPPNPRKSIKKTLNVACCMLLLLGAEAFKAKSDYNIVCEISGLRNDSALIAFSSLSDRDKQIIDTVQFSNGKLKYSCEVGELHEVIIVPFSLIYKFENGRNYPLPSSRILFFINTNEQIKIKGFVKDQCVDYKVKGNRLSEQLAEARRMKIPLFKDRIQLEYVYNTKDEENRNQSEEEDYWEQRKINDKEYAQQNISYIQNNPDAEYSARLLLEIDDKEKAIQLYNSLTEQVKNSYFGIIMGDMINGWALTTPGLQFPDITGNAIMNEDFSLNNYRGKYVLLDFWGSWCPPCLAEIPKLIEISERYREDLVLVGIACRDNRERLIKTLEDHKITWTQIMEGTTRETKYSQRFGVKAYPTKVLLDIEGKVIKTYTGLDDSLYTDIEKIIEN